MSEEKIEAPAPAETSASKPKPSHVQIQDLDPGATKKVAFTKTFTVDYTNPDDGKHLVGSFTVRRPTLGDLSRFGLVKARLNGGEAVERQIDWLNEMLAFCQVTLSEFPEWWDPFNTYDEELLTMLYKHVRSFQDSFRNRMGA